QISGADALGSGGMVSEGKAGISHRESGPELGELKVENADVQPAMWIATISPDWDRRPGQRRRSGRRGGIAEVPRKLAGGAGSAGSQEMLPQSPIMRIAGDRENLLSIGGGGEETGSQKRGDEY